MRTEVSALILACSVIYWVQIAIGTNNTLFNTLSESLSLWPSHPPCKVQSKSKTQSEKTPNIDSTHEVLVGDLAFSQGLIEPTFQMSGPCR